MNFLSVQPLRAADASPSLISVITPLDAASIKSVLRGVRRSYHRRKSARTAEIRDNMEEQLADVRLGQLGEFLDDPAVTKR